MYFNNYETLKNYITFNIDTKVKRICSVKSVEELFILWKYAKLKGWPVLLLGGGSNVLFISNFYGLIILNKIRSLIITESSKEWFIHVGSGNNWHQLVKYLIKNDIYGLENMALIPGSVGAAPIQNIGAYGMEFKDVCHYVNIIDMNNGNKRCLDVTECQFGYRDSVFKNKYRQNFAIISVGLKLKKLWKPVITYTDLKYLIEKKVTAKTIFDIICKIRKSKLPDPCLIGNAGSFFKNPIISNTTAKKIKSIYPLCPKYLQVDGTIKISAGWLIEQCNLKGYKYGGAAVHINQALVLINNNNATGKDILYLARYIKKKVNEKFKIILESEVRFIGKYGEINSINSVL
ncbi:MAG: UDP-N-acetylmuramate dehydrogenase [Arsenophonus endosymbiont of Ceratovacuna japonica]